MQNPPPTTSAEQGISPVELQKAIDDSLNKYSMHLVKMLDERDKLKHSVREPVTSSGATAKPPPSTATHSGQPLYGMPTGYYSGQTVTPTNVMGNRTVATNALTTQYTMTDNRTSIPNPQEYFTGHPRPIFESGYGDDVQPI